MFSKMYVCMYVCMSSNIPLEMSPVLENAISKLAAARFLPGDSCCGYRLYTFYFATAHLIY